MLIKLDGTLWTVGANESGQLGDGTTVQRPTPVQVAAEVAALAAGQTHSLFIKTDGSLWAMGANGNGQLGDGSTTTRTTPTRIASGVAAAAATKTSIFFVKIDGTLWATGQRAYEEQSGYNTILTLRWTPSVGQRERES
jgi:alpha-tubulin suppressor-like RCC1 family protein